MLLLLLFRFIGEYHWQLIIYTHREGDDSGAGILWGNKAFFFFFFFFFFWGGGGSHWPQTMAATPPPLPPSFVSSERSGATWGWGQSSVWYLESVCLNWRVQGFWQNYLCQSPRQVQRIVFYHVYRLVDVNHIYVGNILIRLSLNCPWVPEGNRQRNRYTHYSRTDVASIPYLRSGAAPGCLLRGGGATPTHFFFRPKIFCGKIITIIGEGYYHHHRTWLSWQAKKQI